MLVAVHSMVKHAGGMEGSTVAEQQSVFGSRQRLGLGSLFLKIVAKLKHVLLGPLAEDNGCYLVLVMDLVGVCCGLTFQKLLASVLLEKSLVNDGAREVVNHQLKDGLDLLLSIARVVLQGGIPRTAL